MKFHLLCSILILVFHAYIGWANLPIPELHLEDKINEEDDTEITCTLQNPACLPVTLEIKGNKTLQDCEDTPADCSKKVYYTSRKCTLYVSKDMDEMELTCEAHFRIQSEPKKMHLQSEPTITDCPDKQLWIEGKESSFHCMATGYPQPNVTCQNGHLRYHAGEKFPTLRNMSGDYSCTARNFDAISKIVEVSVEYKPTVKDIILKPLLHDEGDKVTITCEAESEPAPSYTWKTPTPDVQFSPDNKTITIQSMKRSHLGRYQCTASNMHGNHSLEQELSLAVQPNILDIKVKPSTEVFAGDNVSLTCEASGFPPPVLSWSRPTDKVEPSKDQRTIQIWNMMAEHQGNYSCTAKNKHGNATQIRQLTLAVKPKVISINVKPSTAVSENDNLALTCVAQGVPQPTYSWRYPSSNVNLSADNSTINIYGIQQAHAGDYSCTARNKHGQDTMTKNITVTEKENRGETMEMSKSTVLALLVSSLIFCLV